MKLSPGPFLNVARSHMSCGILRWKNPETNCSEKVVVVATGGGHKGYFLESVELLYLNADDSAMGEWIMGPEFPKPNFDTTMIEFKNSVILIAGDDDSKLFQLSSPNGPWIEMRQKLKKRRTDHVSFLIPDELLNCHY